jgi:hypothetical protein
MFGKSGVGSIFVDIRSATNCSCELPHAQTNRRARLTVKLFTSATILSGFAARSLSKVNGSLAAANIFVGLIGIDRTPFGSLRLNISTGRSDVNNRSGSECTYFLRHDKHPAFSNRPYLFLSLSRTGSEDILYID